MKPDALNQNIGTTANIAGLLEALFGSKSSVGGGSQVTTTGGGRATETTSGGTTTEVEKLDITKEGVDALLRELMEDDTTGFARVASGQKLAGLYNSTSRQLLLNDLLTRSAGQVAKLTAPKTRTTTTSPRTTERTEDPRTTTTTKEPVTTRKDGMLAGGGMGILGALALYGQGKKAYDWLSGALATDGTVPFISRPTDLVASGMDYIGAGTAYDMGSIGADAAFFSSPTPDVAAGFDYFTSPDFIGDINYSAAGSDVAALSVDQMIGSAFGEPISSAAAYDLGAFEGSLLADVGFNSVPTDLVASGMDYLSSGAAYDLGSVGADYAFSSIPTTEVATGMDFFNASTAGAAGAESALGGATLGQAAGIIGAVATLGPPVMEFLSDSLSDVFGWGDVHDRPLTPEEQAEQANWEWQRQGMLGTRPEDVWQWSDEWMAARPNFGTMG